MTWEGYNYEDAVLLNERLVRDDVYTSIHIEEYIARSARYQARSGGDHPRDPELSARTRSRILTQDGIIRNGTEVHAGDILVGKVTPKGETELTAEERLLARDLRRKGKRSARYLAPRCLTAKSGIVVDVRVFSRENVRRACARRQQSRSGYISRRSVRYPSETKWRDVTETRVSFPVYFRRRICRSCADGTPLDIVLNPLGVPSRMNIGQVLEVHLGIAAKRLGWKIMTPVFDGATEKDITECIKMAGLDRDVLPSELTTRSF